PPRLSGADSVGEPLASSSFPCETTPRGDLGRGPQGRIRSRARRWRRARRWWWRLYPGLELHYEEEGDPELRGYISLESRRLFGLCCPDELSPIPVRAPSETVSSTSAPSPVVRGVNSLSLSPILNAGGLSMQRLQGFLSPEEKEIVDII